MIEGEGLELVDVTFGRESGRRILRVTVDREGGVDLDTISQISQKVSRRLDLEGFEPGPYALEVSTPGIERPLRRPQDFRRAVGERVQVKTEDGVLVGELRAAEDDAIRIAAAEGERLRVARGGRRGEDGRRLGRRAEEGGRPMNAEMIAALRELEREKGIAFETILGGLQEAMASAYKAHWKQEHPEADDEFVGFRAVIDPETGDLRMWQQELEEVDVPPAEGSDEPGVEMKVISEAEVEVTDDFKGRIGAQTAKQVIFQKLRDAEREMTYEEFAGREGDVVTGIVQQQERRYTLLDLGKVEALLPQGEQVPSEPLRHGERLKAYITEVRRGTKGPQIVVSRTHPGLLKSLFALEVPEINEGIVEIMAVAREPGHRSKIAVASNEPAVDPVGACVGPKGSRVRMVVNELRGEKIDVVPWSDESATFVANALQPAKVREVTVNPETQTALVIVPDYQLSLAIGREGQNARLAARLTGWRIDIKSESQAAEPTSAPAPRSRNRLRPSNRRRRADQRRPRLGAAEPPEDAQAATVEEVATGAGAEPTPEESEPVEAVPAAPAEAE